MNLVILLLFAAMGGGWRLWCSIMSGYSVDLREKAVAYYERSGLSLREAAQVFGVGEASLKRWSWNAKRDEPLTSKPHAGGQVRKLSDDDIEWLGRQLALRPDLTELQWTEVLAAERNVSVSRSAVSRVFVAQGWTRKKSR